MSNSMQGMDTEYAREIAGQMGEHAGQVAGLVGSVSAMLEQVHWTGGNADRFKQDWTGTFAPQAQGAVQSIEDNAHALRQHADRQDEASR